MERLLSATHYEFDAPVWEHEGSAAWHFVSLPEEIADEIEDDHGRFAGGFGSIRVDVTIGATTWSTSLFPDTKRGTYVLPIKKAVRVAEGLADGSTAHIELAVVAGAPGGR